jgi:hypothetical protein
MPPTGLVFRDAREQRDGAALARELTEDLAACGSGEAALLRALLSAAALEGSLDDAGGESLHAITDRLADAYLRRDPSGLAALPIPSDLPADLRVSRPEGFAYYALVPRDLAAAVPPAGPTTVVGIRTIGVALSAVVRAALGPAADRFTVRPHGPPYDRVTTLSADQVARVRRQPGRFIVVDEGPGLSGSSLLSVAEALVAAGVEPDRVLLLGTRAVDPDTLVTRDGGTRWRRFRALAVPPGGHWPAEADPAAELSGGAWRARFWPDPARWPASWTTFERLKCLSRDGHWLFKFEGLGRHGDAVHARAEALGRAGLSPVPAGPPDERGFVAYPLVSGRPLSVADRTPAVIASLGQYCAARAVLFPAAAVDVDGLTEMARANVAFATGVALPPGWRLACERPVIADGRLLPHEWLRTDDGRLTKCDGATHGDDHLYPGPADVAWDLAGAAVEWDLPPGGRHRLVAAYRAVAGEDPRPRLDGYELAYAAFRACASAMAAHGAPGDEAARLQADHHRYRRVLQAALVRSGLPPIGP